MPLNPAQVSQSFKEGELYFFKADQKRYWPRHQWFMATIRSCWESLPEHLKEEYPSPDFLRKRMLVLAGYSKITKIRYSSREDAYTTAALISKFMDDYSVIQVDGSTIKIETARSQAIKISKDDDLMDNDEFKRSCDNVLDLIAILLGTSRNDILETHKIQTEERKASRSRKV